MSTGRNPRMFLLVLFLLLVAALATLAAQASWAPEICDANAGVTTEHHRYLVVNNVGGQSIRQCIAPKMGRADAAQPGFWLTESHEETSFPTYPSVVCGRHPWSGQSTGCLQRPKQLSSIANLEGRFLVSGTEIATGKFNAALDIWILPNGLENQIGSPTKGSTEILFWVASEGMVPGGDWIGQVRLRERHSGVWDEATWDVYYAPAWGDGGWSYIAFVRSPLISRGVEAVNIGDALDYCVAKGREQGAGWCQASDWLVAIEAGFEVYSGGAGLTLDDFGVILDLKTFPLP